MSSRLSEIFHELGISQHLDAFIDQGFDTWETILDITESDLDALGVKLGHRRKLQRRIANARGIPPNAVLASPTKPSVEDIRSEASKPDVTLPLVNDLGAVVVQKRKYRRHPKPDEHAPERPPSAYVLFSNKMRDDLKGQNLTFTEIAKLVGENWQGLAQSEKEPYERQAQAAKEKYTHDLAEYKQTPGYKKYLQYLQDFKAKHGNSDKDATKRARLSVSGVPKPNVVSHHDVPVESAVSNGEVNGGEPPARRQRIGSIVSSDCSYYAPSVLSGSVRTPTEEPSAASPSNGYFDRRELSPSFSASPRDNSVAALPYRRDPSYLDGPRNEGPAPSRHLPSLSDMFDGRPAPNGTSYSNEQYAANPNLAILPRGFQTASPAPTPGPPSAESRPPSLKTEQSSAGSMSSGSSYSSYPRTPTEGPLPIHALLTNTKQFDTSYASNPVIYRSMSPDDRAAMTSQYNPERAPSDSMTAAAPLQMSHSSGYYPGRSAVPAHLSAVTGLSSRPYFAYAGDNRGQGPPPPVSTSQHPTPPNAAQQSSGVLRMSRPNGKAEGGLDGISALLQADRIVDRRPSTLE